MPASGSMSARHVARYLNRYPEIVVYSAHMARLNARLFSKASPAAMILETAVDRLFILIKPHEH
jgi:hypothetical protein